MSSILVVVAYVLTEEPPQMLFVEGYHMVQ